MQAEQIWKSKTYSLNFEIRYLFKDKSLAIFLHDFKVYTVPGTSPKKRSLEIVVFVLAKK